MWSTEHSTETDLTPGQVWAALRGLHTGEIPSPDGDTFRIDGPFAVGTELDVTPQGQETFRSTIIELSENERYADRTEFGDVVLTFRHTLEPVGAGTRVTHQLVIDGPGADTTGPELGPQISADFPASLDGLIASARELAAA